MTSSEMASLSDTTIQAMRWLAVADAARKLLSASSEASKLLFEAEHLGNIMHPACEPVCDKADAAVARAIQLASECSTKSASAQSMALAGV